MIYKAMILRGYGQKDILNLEKEKLNYQHWLACYGLIFISLMIITVEFLW